MLGSQPNASPFCDHLRCRVCARQTDTCRLLGLQHAADNGLVGGSSPPGPTMQSCANPEFPVYAEECVRCLAMAFLLESPAQLADSQVRHLSTPTGALQCAANFCPAAALFWPCSRSMMMDGCQAKRGER
jgi:hypothetical protein